MSATHPGLRIGAVPASGFNTAAPDERARLVRALADAGLDGVLQADHVSFLDGSGTDAIVMMAGLSGAHPTLGLHIGVYLLPLRHPVTVARSLVTLDQLAPGRVVFGVGIGGEDRHEVEVCGVDPRTRGRRCDASLAILRALLDGDTVTHVDEFFAVHECRIRPTPTAPIPVLVGGRSDAAIRRAGRFGDGWLGAWCSPRRFVQAAETCEAEAAAAGRGRVTWRHKYQPWIGVGDSRQLEAGHLGPRPSGPGEEQCTRRSAHQRPVAGRSMTAQLRRHLERRTVGRQVRVQHRPRERADVVRTAAPPTQPRQQIVAVDATTFEQRVRHHQRLFGVVGELARRPSELPPADHLADAVDHRFGEAGRVRAGRTELERCTEGVAHGGAHQTPDRSVDHRFVAHIATLSQRCETLQHDG